MGAGSVPLSLYPAEHRALRELHATGRQLASHWRRLAERLGGAPAVPLRDGVGVARALVSELEEETGRRGLHGFPAAQGVGARVAGVRNAAGDRLLERNQALRLAVLDAEHVATLLRYLQALAEQRGDGGLAAFHERWAGEVEAARDAVRAAAIALATDPDGAVQPAEDSVLGRAGHGAATALGTLGEAFDGSRLGAAARRRAGR